MQAAKRWQKLVRDRLAETESLVPGRGAVGPAFWDSRAKKFAAAMAGTAAKDPLLARVRRHATRRSTVIDVGCGPGRFALALAPRVKEVVAVDSSPAMIDIVRRRAKREGLANVRCVTGAWEDVEVEPVDLAICSYVLPLVKDPVPFLGRLDAATRQRVFVYLGAVNSELVLDPFWRHFHGRPRRLGPTYLDAMAILREMGIKPEVEIVEIPVRARFKSVAAAARAYADSLLLPSTPEVLRELRSLLAPWLVKGDGGLLRPPVTSLPAAIVSWAPR